MKTLIRRKETMVSAGSQGRGELQGLSGESWERGWFSAKFKVSWIIITDTRVLQMKGK